MRWGRQVAEAVDALSRREGEVYTDYIERVSAHPLAVEVKRADIGDNLARIDEITDRAVRVELQKRYVAALKRLGWA